MVSNKKGKSYLVQSYSGHNPESFHNLNSQGRVQDFCLDISLDKHPRKSCILPSKSHNCPAFQCFKIERILKKANIFFCIQIYIKIYHGPLPGGV